MKGIEQSSKVAAQTNQTHQRILVRRLMELSPPIGASASQLRATLPSLISAIFSGGLGGPAIVAPRSCSISFSLPSAFGFASSGGVSPALFPLAFSDVS